MSDAADLFWCKNSWKMISQVLVTCLFVFSLKKTGLSNKN